MKMTTENRVRTLLMKIGVDPSNQGYDYLVEAIKTCYENKKVLQLITKKLYPDIAKKFGTTPSRVERAMRHAVSRIDSVNPEGLSILPFAFSVNGTIPNSQFIAVCVEFLKMHE